MKWLNLVSAELNGRASGDQEMPGDDVILVLRTIITLSEDLFE